MHIISGVTHVYNYEAIQGQCTPWYLCTAAVQCCCAVLQAHQGHLYVKVFVVPATYFWIITVTQAITQAICLLLPGN